MRRRLAERGLPERWGATEAELAAAYPCDRLVDEPFRAEVRAVDVDAPPDLLYRWVCQLRVAPYSYDLLDNWGRRSPRALTPGLDQLGPEDTFLIVEVTDVAYGEHVTGRAPPSARRIYGVLAATYQVSERGPGRSRLVVRIDLIEPRNLVQRVRHVLLSWGDVVMMRKQLFTLKALAERGARAEPDAIAEGTGTAAG